MKLLRFMIVMCFAFVCFGERILVLLPLGSNSHKLAVMPIVEALAQKDHNLTIISGYKSSTEINNVHEIQITCIDKILERVKVNWFETQKEDSLTQLKTMMMSLPHTTKFAYEQIMTHPEFQTILLERNVDLVIVDAIVSELTFPIIEHLGVPFIFHCSSLGIPWAAAALEAMGTDLNYATVPFPMTGFDDMMTFRQRLFNLRMAETFRSMRQSYAFDVLDAYVKKDFPNASPTANIMKMASLVLVNSHVTTDWPRSIPPTVIPIGAVHTRPAKQLPLQLKQIADEASDGFIVFTLGSMIKATSIPPVILQTFLNVFSKLPQRVIWKWEGDVPEATPPNVVMADWLPQQDLLGHPNAKLFMTHGGMLGTQEAIYHAVPLLGFPFCNDQKSNMAMAIKQGFGLKIDWDRINDDLLYNSIKTIINEPSFKENATRLSMLMHDQLVPGTDLAIYWIEHVLRHGGTKHLQVASKNVPFYQRHLVDVVLFLVGISAVMIAFIYRMIRFLVWQCERIIPIKLKRKQH
ncbi:UDP-glycosyltransferase UGT5-like [Daphnia carinata]|uniref:UDP-glycosyltransferase UGT5-like n=1 Tax=Daphnia carinata TaxID=120202 RepID=UPI00257A9EC7|nr:UDP-glycosyltransferase UGT5-like [Daphnia carinata]